MNKRNFIKNALFSLVAAPAIMKNIGKEKLPKPTGGSAVVTNSDGTVFAKITVEKWGRVSSQG